MCFGKIFRKIDPSWVFAVAIITYFIPRVLLWSLPGNNILEGWVFIYDSNLILLIITAFYAYFTYKMLTEMKEARKIQTNPIVTARFEPLGTSHTQFNISNVGNGPAFDIRVKCSVFNMEKEVIIKDWSHTILQSKEKEYLMIDKVNFIDLYKNNTDAIIEIKFKNSYGELKRDKFHLDFNKLYESMEANFWIQRDSTEEDIHNIAERLKDIKSSLISSSKSLDQINRIGFRKQQKEHKKEQDKIISQTFAKLKKK